MDKKLVNFFNNVFTTCNTSEINDDLLLTSKFFKTRILVDAKELEYNNNVANKFVVEYQYLNNNVVANNKILETPTDNNNKMIDDNDDNDDVEAQSAINQKYLVKQRHIHLLNIMKMYLNSYLLPTKS